MMTVSLLRDLAVYLAGLGTLAAALYYINQWDNASTEGIKLGPVENIFPGLPHSSDKNEEGSLADERDYRIQVNTSKDYVMKLENRVMALENLLCEIRTKCDQEHWGHDPLKEKYEDVLKQKEELQLELEQERQAHSTLHEKYDHMIKQKEDLQMECERERQAHNILKEVYEDVIKQNEVLQKGSELIFQTERANNLEKILYSVIRESERKSEELEQERRAYKIFKEKYEKEQYEDLKKRTLAAVPNR